MSGDDNYILVAQIGGAFGVKGEVKITAYTADAQSLKAYSPLLDAKGKPVLTILSARPDKNGLVAKVKELTTKEEADAARGRKLYIHRDQLPEADEDEFYLTDLIGLEGRDAEDKVIGKVKAVQNFGADDMLEIAPAEGGPTWYLPFTKAATPEIKPSEGWLRIIRPTEVSERDED
ncbi:ribosome maturation factor RimM [Brevundimonas sp. BH3]|uniref:ribosome maturation factor RimM n=1 Tax=unclassified Brevundimonas TaxID=2622653 RepID=UPI00289E1401|nr:ribosome maturation factor RimM [Brevundimonas sp.]